MAGEAILIVDDNPMILKLLAVLMRARGYVVEVAADAETALDLVKRFRPKLILLDLQLPGMDGLTLTRQLRADPATRDILIVVVTAAAMKGDELAALAAGVDGYVTKPIDTRTLPDLVAARLASGLRQPASAQP